MVYPKRQLVENKFSILKRKFSGDLKDRRFLMQMKEIATKMIVCNIHTSLLFFIIELFYRAIKMLTFKSEIKGDPGAGSMQHTLPQQGELRQEHT
jgi:hypothetical protein